MVCPTPENNLLISLQRVGNRFARCETSRQVYIMHRSYVSISARDLPRATAEELLGHVTDVVRSWATDAKLRTGIRTGPGGDRDFIPLPDDTTS